MGRLFIVTSGKGGVGKSTFVALLADALTCAGDNRSGQTKKVLLLEQDDGLRCLDIFLGVENSVVYDKSDVFAGSCFPVDALITSSYNRDVYLLPASAQKDCKENVGDIAVLCEGFIKYFDYVIIDEPAGLGHHDGATAACGCTALVVCTPDPVCVRDCAALSLELEECGVSSQRLVINRVPTKKCEDGFPDLDKVIDSSGIQLLGVIGEDPRMAYGLGHGTIFRDCDAVKEAGNIAKRICGEDVPLMLI